MKAKWIEWVEELKILQASLDVMYDQNSISYKANIIL